LIALLAVPAFASDGKDNVITPDLSAIVGGKGWKVRNATAEGVTVDGKRAVRLTATGDSANGNVGLALVDGVDFTTGVIELDLQGQNVRGRSFLGVAFNVEGQRGFEAIYFRPFNFKAEGDFKNRAVQYISWPDHTWEGLRKTRPGKFEAAIRPVPDPDKWFHARIEVDAKQVRVFVNEAKEPCLTVERLAEVKKGRPMGLFVDSADGLYANLEITPA
jgi:hypothetical protein